MGIITNMRTQMQPVMWAILILFIASMAVGGLVGGANIGDIFGNNSSNNVGSLNGNPIAYDDFNRLVFDEITRIEKQSGESMNDADREYVRAVVWERLIQDLLIQEQIEENKILVSDSEVLYQLQNNPPAFLQTSPIFRTDGQFDLEKYMEAVMNPGELDWRPIEDFMQNIYLPNYKLQQLIINAASTSNQDIVDSYRQRFINYNLEVLHITDKAIAEDFALEPSEEQLMKIYNENIDDYKEPEMRYMKYVKWPIVSDYSDSLRVELEAKTLIDRINQGELFTELANSYTEDPGNSVNPDSLNGGKLGWFNKGQMVKEFEDAAFSGANKGEVVGPILTQFGYHIIKINDKRTTEEGEEEVNASHILLRIFSGKDTENKLRNLSSIFSLESKEYGFFDLADSLGMEIYDASSVQKKSIFIDDIGVARNAVKFAFGSEIGETSDYIENDDYFIVCYLDSVSDEKTMSFDSVKEILIEESTKNIKDDEIKRIADGIVNKNLDLLKLSEQNPAFEYVKETSGNLIGSFESIGKSNYISGALISSEKGDLLGPLPTLRGQAFVKVLDIDELNEEDFDEKKESLKFSLIIQRQNLIWSNWLQGLRDDSEIEDKRFDFY